MDSEKHTPERGNTNIGVAFGLGALAACLFVGGGFAADKAMDLVDHRTRPVRYDEHHCRYETGSPGF